MTVKTPHFGLEAFVLGDVYRGIVDQRRFTTIDMHMAFISDLIGQGKIDGWDISFPSNLTMKVSSGWGMINRNITRTFGSYEKSLLDDNTVYVWMRLRSDVIGQISAFSNMLSISYTDTSTPSVPSGFSAIPSVDKIELSWNQSSEINFEKYQIYRSLNNIDFYFISDSETSSYTDIDLEENKSYYYKIRTVNLTGTVGNFTSVLKVDTLKDLSKPATPGSVVIESSDSMLHITWNASSYGDISYYKIQATPVTVENIINGATNTFLVDSSKVDVSVFDLSNDIKYLIEIQAVSKNDVESDKVIRYGIPKKRIAPPDIVDIAVIDYPVTSVVSTNGITLNWVSSIDSYSLSFTGISEILIEEYHVDGTVIISNWIPVLAGITTKSIEIFPYNSNNQKVFKSIESRTVYYITIRNIDDSGNVSVGKRIKHYTKNFQSPNPIKALSILDKGDKSLVAKWINSDSIFLNNIITVTKKNLTTLQETILVDGKNIGTSTIYILDSSFSEQNYRYTFSVYCIDEFDNNSSSVNSSFDVLPISLTSRPPVPSQQIGFAGDKQNNISWNRADINNISGYRIYRADDAVSLRASSFVLLETVSSDIYTYTDYEVVNDSSYVYFVTTVDSYGQESLNPVSDGYINYPFMTLSPSSNAILPPPLNLVNFVVSRTVQLFWQPTGGQFDGYEIYRSINNKYSFELIATTSSSVTAYVDTNVFNKSMNVYYIVRKFRNEADLFVTESNIAVTNAVYLGSVTTSDGEPSLNLSNVRSIKYLEDPIREETIASLSVHKHSWNSDQDDRRINLGDKLLVDDWVSSDNKTYTTVTDISNTTTFSVFINDQPVSIFGILFYLDKVKGELTFEERLASTGFDTEANKKYLFTDPPSITIIFNNLQETQNILPKERVDGLSAQQSSSGFIRKSQLPNISHDGRRRERLLPIQIDTSSIDDGYRYTPSDSSQTFGTAIVFYDIFQSVEDTDTLIASTSDGIYLSRDFGITYSRVFSPPTPVIKFFYSTKFKSYFAGTNRGVLFGQGGGNSQYNTWNEVSGIENAKVIRDFISNISGDLFCSSNIGVFKLRRDIGQGSLLFQQLPIFGPKSTESYAMLYDTIRNRIIVSNELGIFETNNDGVSWLFSDEFSDQRPIYCFAQSNGYIFALTDYMIWRRGPHDEKFERIAVFENATISRKLVIWNNKIYVTTDSGLLTSLSENNIYTDSVITFNKAFSLLAVNSIDIPATSINIIDDKLFIGSENQLFVSERVGNLSLHSQFENKITPTIYVDGVEQSIGYRFTTGNTQTSKFLCFDVKQNINAKITIANQYQNFKTSAGGWADQDYTSSVGLVIDGAQINDISLAEKPAQSISQIVLPSYNDRNAHQIGADLAKSNLNNAVIKLLQVASDSTGQITALKGFTKENVFATLTILEKFLSQIYPTARTVEQTDSQQNVTTVPFEVPPFRVLLLSSPSRTALTKSSIYGKYKDWVKISKNSDPTVIGNFGSELTKDGLLPNSLINPDIIDKGPDKSEGFGVQKYNPIFGSGVGDIFPQDYSSFNVVSIINSVTGMVTFAKPMTKYNRIDIDIINPSFINTGMPHWVIEDTFEWVNSGTPSHLSQVRDANVISSGITEQWLSTDLQANTSPSYQSKYIVPCDASWYNKVDSTIDYDLIFDNGNRNLSLPYVNSAIYVSEINKVLVGGYGGVLSIDVETKQITRLEIPSDRDLLIKDIRRHKNKILILDESKLYFYDIETSTITYDTATGLPPKLYRAVSVFNDDLVIGGSDGIYARKSAAISWQKVVSTNKPVNILLSPDAILAISDSGESFYSTDGFNWNRIGIINEKIVNKIEKHRSQILVATNSGLYQDSGSFYTKNLSLAVLDILNDASKSVSVAVNDISSDFTKIVIGLSDGRYITYTDSFIEQPDSKLSTIHKILIVGNDIWLFGYNQFRLASEDFIRKLATGLPLI